MHCVGWNAVNVSWNDVGVLDWMELCMVGLTTANGFLHSSLLRPSTDILRTICEHTLDNCPFDPLFFDKNDGHRCMWLRLCIIVESFYSQVRNIFQQFFAWPSMTWDKEDMVSASSFPEAFVDSFSLGPAKILDSNISLWFVTMSLLVAHSLWIQPTYTWSRNNVGSPWSKSVSCFLLSLPVYFVHIHR